MTRMKATMASKILDKYDSKITTCVETGTWRGHTTRIFSGIFARVHTIDYDLRHYNTTRKAMRREGKWRNVKHHLGDSKNWIPILSQAYENRPVFWFLDAHWQLNDALVNEFSSPLMSELDVLAARTQPDIICVDDIHAFGRDTLTWSNVSYASILSRLPDGRVKSSAKCGDHFAIWCN